MRSLTRRCGIVLGIALLPGLTSCTLLEQHNRIRLTAEVMVGGTHYFGSTVQEYKCSQGGGPGGTMFLGVCNINGDAVVVDLKDRGYLFLIVQGHSALDRTSLAKGVLASRPAPTSHRWAVREDAYPVMVHFQDVKDHSTIEVTTAATIQNTLGPDVSFVGLTAEDTEDPVTTGIVDRALPWIQGYDRITTIQTGTDYMGTGPAYHIQVLDFKARG